MTWRNGLNTGSPNLCEERKQNKREQKFLMSELKKLWELFQQYKTYLHTLKVHMKKLIDKIWRNVWSLLCWHSSLKQPRTT